MVVKLIQLIIDKYFIFIFMLFFISCQRLIDQNSFNSGLKNYTSPYQGTWYGKYSGDTSGDLLIVVFKAGNLQVTRSFYSSNEIFYGQVYDDGILNNTSSQSGFSLIGSLNSKNGTWKINSQKGNWLVNKH